MLIIHVLHRLLFPFSYSLYRRMALDPARPPIDFFADIRNAPRAFYFATRVTLQEFHLLLNMVMPQVSLVLFFPSNRFYLSFLWFCPRFPRPCTSLPVGSLAQKVFALARMTVMFVCMPLVLMQL